MATDDVVGLGSGSSSSVVLVMLNHMFPTASDYYYKLSRLRVMTGTQIIDKNDNYNTNYN